MRNENSTCHGSNNLDPDLPRTATKPVAVPKKRGRKGNKLAVAFKEIPIVVPEKCDSKDDKPVAASKNIPLGAVDFAEYAEAHGVSTKSLRQIKRHDPYKETGKAFVNKDMNVKSETYGTMRIWRVANKTPQ